MPTATTTPYANRGNAGGVVYPNSSTPTWAADQAFATGSWGYVSGSAKSSTTAVNGTVDDLLYQKYREAMTEYRYTLPNGTYQVTLKFAEFGATASGKRVMKVTMEGVVVQASLDVYAVAGKATALDKVYTTTVGDGQLNILFSKVSGNLSPMVSAIEVISASGGASGTSTPTPTQTPGGPTNTPTATPTPLPFSAQRVNAGGTAFTDSLGLPTWASDQIYAAGSWGYTGGTGKSTTIAVAGTIDDGLYQKWRENAGEYRFTVPNGVYLVTLRFAEFEVSKATSRIMKITIEGVIVENSLSVYGTVGSATALDRTYTVTVADGVLNIAFAQNGGTKLPMVSAIQVKM